jgi:hypothetical protein
MELKGMMSFTYALTFLADVMVKEAAGAGACPCLLACFGTFKIGEVPSLHDMSLLLC